MTLKFVHSGPNSYLWIVERNNGGVVEVVAQVGVEEVARETEAAENHQGPDHPLLAPENINLGIWGGGGGDPCQYFLADFAQSTPQKSIKHLHCN